MGAMSALVFFCHGSRDPGWRAPFDQLLAEQRRRQPAVAAELAFLESMSPDLATVIDALAGSGQQRLRIVPLFLATGTHARQDLGTLLEAARQRWPEVSFEVDAALLESAGMRQAILDALTCR